MNATHRAYGPFLLLFLGNLHMVTAAAAQSKFPEAVMRKGTVQSELDYLRAARFPISIDLKQVTVKQAYDDIALKAGLTIVYEGALNGGTKHDLSFGGATVKEVLGKLGDAHRLTYRVDGPTKLTVIGRKPESL